MKIGLAISGGGYRATAYSLGTLGYLDAIKFNESTLLEHVDAISTVSGGSITGLSYALAVKQGVPFDQYMRSMYDFAIKEDLVNESLKNLITEKEVNSLISGFAKTYNDRLFNQATYKDLLPKKDSNGKKYANGLDTHLTFSCINATDFNYGVPFRFIFRAIEDSYAIGNGYVRLTADKLINMPLGVPLAASSCFPGGFEPISFKKDEFSADKESKENPLISLMDGGIVDNQGIDSLVAYSEKNNESTLDLVMVVDVSTANISSFKPTKKKKIKLVGNLSMATIFLSNLLTNFILAGVFFLPKVYSSSNLVLLLTVLLTINILITIGLLIGRSVVKNAAENSEVGFGKIKQLDALTPNLIFELLTNRLSSLSLLVGSVFMKHLRKSNYDLLYKNYKYKYRRLSSIIDVFNDKKNISLHDLKPSEDMIAICKEASRLGTTLWFTNNDGGKKKFINVVVAGQIISCYEMIRYYRELEAAKPITAKDPEYLKKQLEIFKTVYDQSLVIWNGLQSNPYYLVNREGIETKSLFNK